MQDAGGVPQQEQLRVVTFGDERAGPAAGPLDRDDLVAGQPGQHVDLVNSGVGHRGGGVLAGIGLDIAVNFIPSTASTVSTATSV